ncbi:hypothetical protein I7I48_04905 [Histoplasma ohiense]|nr:hypothetical protein I7I48_04905 [Histoplasma ohiense (nom. inval.)]
MNLAVGKFLFLVRCCQLHAFCGNKNDRILNGQGSPSTGTNYSVICHSPLTRYLISQRAVNIGVDIYIYIYRYIYIYKYKYNISQRPKKRKVEKSRHNWKTQLQCCKG